LGAGKRTAAQKLWKIAGFSALPGGAESSHSVRQIPVLIA